MPVRQHFVVVDDPVPGGLEPVDGNLATAVRGDRVDGDEPHSLREAIDPAAYWFTRGDWRGFASAFNGFYHRELLHHSARFFADELEAGHYHLSYSAQAIATGSFQMAPVRAEQMYAPQVYGLGLAGTLEVAE